MFTFTLGRNPDFKDRTNKLILLMSLIVAVLGWFLTGNMLSGVYIGAGVFLTWALSRELDPKHNYSAFIASAISILNLFYYQNFQFLTVFWIMLLMRIVNGITGKELTLFDVFSVLGLTIYLSLSNQNSIYLFIYFLAMIFVIKTSEQSNKVLVASGISLGFFVVESFIIGYLSFNRIDYLHPMSIVTFSLLSLSFLLFLFLSKDKIEDDKGNRVKNSKIIASQLLYSLTIFLLFFFEKISINNLIIYLSVILGVSIYFVAFKVVERR
ncbi:hypothetical protein [Carnobacterium sp.]|uniref:hypothetical protein n=1 Tax=Carnobacterium sp. TaxID=48221 RepID=UPI003C76F639